MSVITNLVDGTTKSQTPRTYNNTKTAPTSTWALPANYPASDPGYNAFAAASASLYPAAQNTSNPTPTAAAAAPPDPYAKYGGVDNFNTLRTGYDTSKATTYGGITDATTAGANSYRSGILDYTDNLGIEQNKLNTSKTQNELSKLQGTHGILDMVGNGIRSGGVQLANSNSGSSSAAEALARAYNTIGGREMNTVNNQYEMGNLKYNNDQSEFDIRNAGAVRHINENKTSITNGIVNSATVALNDLNAKAANGLLPDNIDVNAERERIRGEAMGKLTGLDQLLADGQAKAKPIDGAAAKGQAYQQNNAGVTADNPFNFTTTVPGQFQGTGPFASELPVFQTNKPKTQF